MASAPVLSGRRCGRTRGDERDGAVVVAVEANPGPFAAVRSGRKSGRTSFDLRVCTRVDVAERAPRSLAVWGSRSPLQAELANPLQATPLWALTEPWVPSRSAAAGCAATDHVATGGSEQRGDATCRNAAIGEAGDGFVTFGTREPDGVSSHGSFDGDLIEPGFAVTPLARAHVLIVVVVVDVVPCPRREPTELGSFGSGARGVGALDRGAVGW